MAYFSKIYSSDLPHRAKAVYMYLKDRSNTDGQCYRLIVNTCMGMLDVCPDQKLCGRIIEYLAPIQLGEKEAGEILAVERNVADEYFAMEDEEVTMAECQML